MNRIRKGDLVRVTRGSLKGKEGKIKEVIVSKSRALVEGVGKYKRYQKGKGTIEKERAIHVSNLALITNDKKKKAYKASFVIKEDGKKERVPRSSKSDKS
ncbi:50S ribosomal protein L24 [Mycoplasma ovis str. Michigan]|uniref:Large ribosomal subunit protein uL24 n=1 Tax=Mycoplasma ovis str. Michigan TaxID=1415773 RepID=A0ABM5P0P3_9MOLU|nr:50S ribosomal protein L24 [Mycoplasma ovis]AHC39972.1 50S ribosomal protein L24 [Mycoplasma ovis str. Michigan]